MEVFEKRLSDILEIRGELELLTGLHIGAGKDEVKIGGMDNPVVRNPLTGEPYIPGSSLKGKMRMLLELYYGVFNYVDKDPRELGNVLSYEVFRKLKDNLKDEERLKGAKAILKLFGTSGADFGKLDKNEWAEVKELASTRLSFYDLKLTKESRAKLENKVGKMMTEEKMEVKINRITGTAFGRALTSKERIPAGAKFDFKLCLKVFEGDNEEELLNVVRKGLRLLELDSLGGSGSRGYGKVRFVNLKCISHLKEGGKEERPFDLDSAF
jgi:CRISPR-associated protein Csm3